MKIIGQCPACLTVKPLNQFKMGLCDECAHQYEHDMFVNDLKTAALSAQFECPGALPHIQRAIQAAEME